MTVREKLHEKLYEHAVILTELVFSELHDSGISECAPTGSVEYEKLRASVVDAIFCFEKAEYSHFMRQFQVLGWAALAKKNALH